MTSFATVDDLAAALGVAVPTDDLIIGQWQAALDDASGYLRTVIGQPVNAGTAQLTVRTDDHGGADLWLVPVTAITEILDPDGNAVASTDWDLQGQHLQLRRPCVEYTVSLTYGYATVPAELARWTKVLASVQIQAAAGGTLGLDSITSVAVDDGKVTYEPGMTVQLSDTTAQWLKATFGGPQ